MYVAVVVTLFRTVVVAVGPMEELATCRLGSSAAQKETLDRRNPLEFRLDLPDAVVVCVAVSCSVDTTCVPCVVVCVIFWPGTVLTTVEAGMVDTMVDAGAVLIIVVPGAVLTTVEAGSVKVIVDAGMVLYTVEPGAVLTRVETCVLVTFWVDTSVAVTA